MIMDTYFDAIDTFIIYGRARPALNMLFDYISPFHLDIRLRIAAPQYLRRARHAY